MLKDRWTWRPFIRQPMQANFQTPASEWRREKKKTAKRDACSGRRQTWLDSTTTVELQQRRLLLLLLWCGATRHRLRCPSVCQSLAARDSRRRDESIYLLSRELWRQRKENELRRTITAPARPHSLAFSYTQGEVTSRSLWSRYDRHFVGITRCNVLELKSVMGIN